MMTRWKRSGAWWAATPSRCESVCGATKNQRSQKALRDTAQRLGDHHGRADPWRAEHTGTAVDGRNLETLRPSCPGLERGCAAPGRLVAAESRRLSLNPWIGDFERSSVVVGEMRPGVDAPGACVIRWPAPAFPCYEVPRVGPGMAGWTRSGQWGQAARGCVVG